MTKSTSNLLTTIGITDPKQMGAFDTAKLERANLGTAELMEHLQQAFFPFAKLLHPGRGVGLMVYLEGDQLHLEVTGLQKVEEVCQ